MLSSVIDSFATGTYAVTRSSAGTYDSNGRYVDGSTSVVNIDASIQPMSGSDLKTLPEGLHASNARTMFSKVEVFTAGPGGKPDVVSFKGEDWKVINVMAWEGFGSGSGADHYESTIARKPAP